MKCRVEWKKQVEKDYIENDSILIKLKQKHGTKIFLGLHTYKNGPLPKKDAIDKHKL